MSNNPTFNIRDYFNGTLKGWGMIQDFRSKPITSFTLTMQGNWDGDSAKLSEEFIYQDGKTQPRLWEITDLGNNQFRATADDIIGTAHGHTSGNAGYWRYTLQVPYKNKTLNMQVDDRMWLQPDGVLINRSKLKKFGLTLAELTIFLTKESN